MSKTRSILVQRDDDTEFKIEVPAESSLTFGPFSPPSGKGIDKFGDRGANRGTLRVYAGAKASANKVIAVFAGIQSFRDLSVIDLAQKVHVEQGATVWNSDKDGYSRTEKVRQASHFEGEDAPRLTSNVADDGLRATEELEDF